MLQRRSKPVNGSVLAFVVSVGVVLAFAGAVSLVGSDVVAVFVGVVASFDGNVPVVGVVDGAVVDVVVVVFGVGVVLP